MEAVVSADWGRAEATYIIQGVLPSGLRDALDRLHVIQKLRM